MQLTYQELARRGRGDLANAGRRRLAGRQAIGTKRLAVIRVVSALRIGRRLTPSAVCAAADDPGPRLPRADRGVVYGGRTRVR